MKRISCPIIYSVYPLFTVLHTPFHLPRIRNLVWLGCVFFTVVINPYAQAQTRKACELTSVAEINNILGTSLIFDANSPINKSGQFECRYTNPQSPGQYVAVGLLEAKIEYGYDMQKTDFDTNQKAIASGGKAVGKFTRFYPFAAGGPTAYYMTGEKDDFSPEAFVFHFRKGNYIVTFSAAGLPLKTLTSHVDALFKLGSKL